MCFELPSLNTADPVESTPATPKLTKIQREVLTAMAEGKKLDIDQNPNYGGLRYILAHPSGRRARYVTYRTRYSLRIKGLIENTKNYRSYKLTPLGRKAIKS